MTDRTHNYLDSHDWAARASEALAQAKKLPPDRNDPQPSEKPDNFALRQT